MRVTTSCSTRWPNIPSSSSGRSSSHRKARGWLVRSTRYARSCEPTGTTRRGAGSLDGGSGRMRTEKPGLSVDLVDHPNVPQRGADREADPVLAVSGKQRDIRFAGRARLADRPDRVDSDAARLEADQPAEHPAHHEVDRR